MEKISIAKGNTKMGNGMPSISLPPGVTCSEEARKTCLKECYIMKAFRMYKQTRAAYRRNLKIYQRNPSDFFGQLEKFLEKRQPRFFRFFVGGDFPDQPFVNMSLQLARKFPNVKFLAFTKRYHFDFGNKPDNFAVVLSMWPGMKDDVRLGSVNFPRAWMQDGTETRIPKSAIECHGGCSTCGMCWNLGKLGKDVYFHKH